MKLKFKLQAYQTQAVESVVDCFKGQPKTTGIQYRANPGPLKAAIQQSLLDDSGSKNSAVALTQA